MRQNLDRSGTPRATLALLVIGGVLSWAIVPGPVNAQDKPKPDAKDQKKPDAKPQAKAEKKSAAKSQPKPAKKADVKPAPTLPLAINQIRTIRLSSRNRSPLCKRKWPRSSSKLPR